LLILLGVPPLGGYNYITPRRAGLSATADSWAFLFICLLVRRTHVIFKLTVGLFHLRQTNFFFLRRVEHTHSNGIPEGDLFTVYFI